MRKKGDKFRRNQRKAGLPGLSCIIRRVPEEHNVLLTSDPSFTIMGEREVTWFEAEVRMAKDMKDKILTAALDLIS